MSKLTHSGVLKSVYDRAVTMVANDHDEIKEKMSGEEVALLDEVIRNSESKKGVLTVLITSMVHKVVEPEQDTRFHQGNMEKGYSGRGIDTRYVTPFMKSMNFPAMAESGWLTRSLEQNIPYTLDYPGRITPIALKTAFLNLLDFIETKKQNPEIYLLYLIMKLIIERDKQNINLAKPSNLTINTISNYVDAHFNSYYASRGASRLPTLAIYSAYECMMNEVKRFDDKVLLPLEEHTSADSRSGRIGDIDIMKNDRVFEGVELKHGIKISPQMIRDSYEKFKIHPVQRYYILSTAGCDESLMDEINSEIRRVEYLHGCQIIVNGVISSLKYYLRLLDDTYEFIDKYVENIKKDSTLKFEHKEKWNIIVSR